MQHVTCWSMQGQRSRPVYTTAHGLSCMVDWLLLASKPFTSEGCVGQINMLPALWRSCAATTLLQQLSCSTVAARHVATSASSAQPVAQPAASPSAKPPLFKDFQIYRWTPEESDKPKYVTYKVDINRCACMRQQRRAGRPWPNARC
jgi:hypothetical protein